MDFEPIVNRVAESDLMVFNLEDFWDGGQVREIDLAQYLFKGLILKENAFREAVKELDLEEYRDAHVAVSCSTNAVIPTWAYMLMAARLAPVAASVSYGTTEELVRQKIGTSLATHDWSKYEKRNVIVKGCPSDIIPTAAYLDAVTRLQPVAAKIMYGEACSSVPIWRRPADSKTTRKAVAARLPKTPQE